MSRSDRIISSTSTAGPEITLIERLRQRGWRLTPQRRAVAEALTGEHLHLTAEEIHARAAIRLPEVGRATVYNTLHELVEIGELREVTLGGGATRYDPAAPRSHHHLVCQKCRLTRDVYPENVDKLELTARDNAGFVMKHTEIVFWGLCANCTSRKLVSE